MKNKNTIRYYQRLDNRLEKPGLKMFVALEAREKNIGRKETNGFCCLLCKETFSRQRLGNAKKPSENAETDGEINREGHIFCDKPIGRSELRKAFTHMLRDQPLGEAPGKVI